MSCRRLPLSVYVCALREAGLLCEELPSHDLSIEIAAISADSRRVEPSTLFICKGQAFKPEYLERALQAGASAYMTEGTFEDIEAAANVPHLLVSDVRRAMAIVADLFYDHPSTKIDVCAFTGTKGKTTSAYYLKGILDERARACAVHATPIFSSVVLDDGVEAKISELTTPEPIELQRHLARAAGTGAREVVMEVSSQALKYDRTSCVRFAVAAFTNIGEDHISPIEHADFEDYFSSKLKIFRQARTAVVNIDADFSERILDAAAACRRVLTCSQFNSSADIYLETCERVPQGLALVVRTPDYMAHVLVPTPARLNASNALLAIGCAVALGVEQRFIETGFLQVRVPGRMQLLAESTPQVIGIVDFAHNGMSLEAALKDLRESYPDRRLCVVFGSTGGKGLDRRQTMGQAAGKYADSIVITEDDPGPEEVRAICETIAHYVEEQGNHAWQIIENREEAIRVAVRDCARPAVVLVSGKGHETRMVRKDGDEPCEPDAALLARALEEFG